MARKGQFKKGGGRHGGTSSRPRSRSRRSTALVVVAPPRAPARRRSKHAHVVHHRRGRRKGSGGPASGCTIPKLIGTTLILGNVAGTNNGPLGATVYNLVQKIPGTKTFGGAATAGMVLGAVGKWTGIGGPRLRPWLRCAGIVGVIAAGLKVAEQGTAFKWLGDADTVMEVE